MLKFTHFRSVIIIFFIIGLISLFVSSGSNNSSSNNSSGNNSGSNNSGVLKISAQKETSGINGPKSSDGSKGFPETVAEIMERDKHLPPQEFRNMEELMEEHLVPRDRRDLPSDPDAKPEAFYPPNQQNKNQPGNTTDNPQTVSTSFTAATLSGTNPTFSFPADCMGAVGPSQFIVAVNGRIVTFNKTTGAVDGVLNTSCDNFFNSVMTVGGFTSDPRVRYDRVTQRWFIVIIDVPASFNDNRILFAVSNTSVITNASNFTFFFIQIASISPSISTSCLADYPTLGIDNSALYIGTNNFCPSFNSTDGYVINKANLIAGTLSATVFRGLVPTSASDGPYTPQGVDNFDASATEGYFIGVSNTNFSRLVMRRVSNPGTTPSISANILISTVNATTFPETVNHLGNTGGTNGRLDALDDRLFAACIRNGRLWTAHNFEVNSSGVASSSGSRIGTRWYELTSLTGTPSINQSGTIFDNAATNPISYWIPTVMVSGQNHAAFIFSSAGLNNRINQSTSGRLSGDALGTTQTVTNVTSSSTAYNPSSDPGGTSGRRWGDYSYVSLDPNDDMTMWGVAGFCDASNSYGVRVTKLLAPPPPALTSANPSSLNPGQSSINVIITGTPTTGQGFYDPGAGFTNRISAVISGGVTVNSVTYNSATQVTLNVSTVGATTGSKTVTITNPDGQFVSSSSIFDVPLPVSMGSFNFSVDKRNVKLLWTTIEEVNNKGFEVERQNIYSGTESSPWGKIGFIECKENSHSPNNYSYEDKNLTSGKYNYRLKQLDLNGNFEYHNLSSPVSIGKPNVSELTQNYPNPFNPLTKIDYGIPADGKVSLTVYDVTGKVVAELVNENKTAGYYSVEFNASKLASGVYFYRIVSPGFSQVRKMLVIK